MQPDHAPHAPSQQQWTITPLTPADIPSVAAFNRAARGELFPRLANKPDGCLTHSDALFVVARATAVSPSPTTPTSASASTSSSTSPSTSPEIAPADATTRAKPSMAVPPLSSPPPGAIIGVVGLIPFDPRFPSLPALPARTAEVVRLYVAHPYRRCGLAGELFRALRERAQERGWECFYLHTHSFLPGAVRFWEKMGFELMLIDDDPWQSHHMRLMEDRGTQEKKRSVYEGNGGFAA